LKELHRPPPLATRQTSGQVRYLTTDTNAAKRLRALGPFRNSSLHSDGEVL